MKRARHIVPLPKLLFAGGGRNVGIFLLEALDATRGVDQLLFAGEERVAVRADFDAEHVAFDGRARLERIAAGAVHRYRMIVGMNTGFHESPISRGRSARPPKGQQPRR